MVSSHANPESTAIERELEAVYRLYAALAPEMDAEVGLGGKLLYAGEPDEAAGRLVRAANIAGAATLAASADAALLRGAMREGIVDFVVTSLDEALRILKNEIRKRQTVAVGVSIAPQAIAREMVERGVQPDLLAPSLADEPELNELRARGARRIARPSAAGAPLQIFPIPAQWSQRTAAFDALLLDALPAEDFVNRRWVRLAPRYADRRARQVRLLACDAEPVLQRIARMGTTD